MRTLLIRGGVERCDLLLLERALDLGLCSHLLRRHLLLLLRRVQRRLLGLQRLENIGLLLSARL